MLAGRDDFDVMQESAETCTEFSIVAQLVNLFVFGIRPEPAILVGGALMVAGGLVITL